MSGIYQSLLPQIFPICLKMDNKREAQKKIRELIKATNLQGHLLVNGSSFAYTADGPYLWLSAVSARILGVNYESDALGRIGPGYGQKIPYMVKGGITEV